jgi:hypothetical protein
MSVYACLANKPWIAEFPLIWRALGQLAPGAGRVTMS